MPLYTAFPITSLDFLLLYFDLHLIDCESFVGLKIKRFCTRDIHTHIRIQKITAIRNKKRSNDIQNISNVISFRFI